jgi:hypothetical protein
MASGRRVKVQAEALLQVLADGVARNLGVTFMVTYKAGSARLGVSCPHKDRLKAFSQRADGLLEVITEYGGVLIDPADVLWVSWVTDDFPGHAGGPLGEIVVPDWHPEHSEGSL